MCYSVLPYTANWGAAQRVHYMANYLADDFDVTVIGSKSSSETSGIRKKRKYHALHFENPLESMLFKNKQSDLSIGNSQHNRKWYKTALYNMAVQSCTLLNHYAYNEPIYFQGIIASSWLRRNKNDILKLLVQNGFKVLIVSIPPWNMINNRFLNQVKRTGIKVIVDYRDPWNCWNDNSGLPYIKEKKILSVSDAVIVTNDNHANRLIKDFSLSRDKVYVVMNGYYRDSWNNPIITEEHAPTDKLVISYIGTIGFDDKSSFRDPRKFMKALSEFEYKDDVLFRVIGCYNEEAINKYRESIPHFEMIGRVSQVESFKWMKRSHVLVNFHTTNDNSSCYLIAGKIFDYYRSGAKILSINGEMSFERKFVEETHIGYYSPNVVETILNTIRKIYSDWKTNAGDFHTTRTGDEFSRQYQNSKIRRIMVDLNIV